MQELAETTQALCTVARLLTIRVLEQGYIALRLKSSSQKMCGRPYELMISKEYDNCVKTGQEKQTHTAKSIRLPK